MSNPLTNFMLLAALALASTADRAVANDGTARNLGKPTTFEHHWQSGDQQYQLGDQLLTRELLSVNDIKSIARNTGRPDDPKDRAVLDDQVQPVSYQENLDDAAESTEVDGESTDDAGKAGLQDRAPYPAATGNPGKTPDALRQEIKAYQEAIKADEQISDGVRSSRLQILTSANEALQRYLELQAQRLNYDKQIVKIKSQEQEKELRDQLDQVIEPGKPVVDESTLSETLTSQLNQRREQLDQKKTALKELEQQIQFHSERVTQIPIDRAQANEKQRRLREDVSAQTLDDIDSQLGLLLQEMKLLAVEEELKKLDSEVRRQELGAKIDPIQRDLWSRDVRRLEDEVKRWEIAAKDVREAEVDEEQQIADQEAATAHWSLKPLAERNAALIEEQKTIVEKLQVLKTGLTKITKETEDIVERRTEIEHKIEAAGLTATNGMLLVDLRRNLIATGESHVQIRKLQSELRQVNLSKVSLKEERDELADPVNTVKQIIDSNDLESPLAKKAIKFVETKRDYLDQLIDDHQSYGRQISEVSEARKKLIDEINQTLAYVDENALWIRSAEPVALSNFNSAQQGLSAFFNSNQWSDVAARTQQRMSRRPYESALALFSMFFLFVINRRYKQKLQPTEESDESST